MNLKNSLSNILKDNKGQGAAEYILLFGGVIAISIAVLLIYKTYIQGVNPLSASADINSIRGSTR